MLAGSRFDIGCIKTIIYLVQPKLDAAICTNEQLPVTQRHSPISIICLLAGSSLDRYKKMCICRHCQCICLSACSINYWPKKSTEGWNDLPWLLPLIYSFLKIFTVPWNIYSLSENIYSLLKIFTVFWKYLQFFENIYSLLKIFIVL